MELFDYEDRLFAIFDGSRGFVWQSGEWRPVTAEVAGKVWASGREPQGDPATFYGADVNTLPADEA